MAQGSFPLQVLSLVLACLSQAAKRSLRIVVQVLNSLLYSRNDPVHCHRFPSVRNHSVAFTMDQHADAWPEQIASAGEAAARLLLPSEYKTANV
jgi:hypothetical protein